MAFVLSSKGTNNLFLFHLYTILEFTLITFIFFKRTTKNYLIPFLIFAGAFLLLCIVNIIFWEGLDEFNTIPRAVEGISVIIYCFVFFFWIFNAEENFDLLKYDHFWLFSGWLIYFSGTFFLYLFSNHQSVYFLYPIIHSVLNIFLNLIYTYVLWLGSRKSITS